MSIEQEFLHLNGEKRKHTQAQERIVNFLTIVPFVASLESQKKSCIVWQRFPLPRNKIFCKELGIEDVYYVGRQGCFRFLLNQKKREREKEKMTFWEFKKKWKVLRAFWWNKTKKPLNLLTWFDT